MPKTPGQQTAEVLAKIRAGGCKLVSFATGENLLRLGLAWVDADGVWHEGQPPVEHFAEALHNPTRPSTVKALHAANAAAREVGLLLTQLEKAEAADREAHRQAHIAAAAEISRRYWDVQQRLHDERVAEYFNSRAQALCDNAQ